MKKQIITMLTMLVALFAGAQAYTGSGDQKFQVGINAQDNGTGITATYDFGVGPNISLGLLSTYVLGVNEAIGAEFGDRFDIKARLNANLGNVFELGEEVDVYPGLNLGLRNFGGHFGVRYFFSEGFGLFAEAGFPIARYNNDNLTFVEKLNNQFNVTIGASFNIL